MSLSFEKIKKETEMSSFKEVEYGDDIIRIRQYLPASEKYRIINAVAILGGAINGKRDYFIEKTIFEKELVLHYSDIEIDNKERNNFYSVYDILYQSGIRDLVIDNIPDEEYEELASDCAETVKLMAEYAQSFAYIWNKLDEYIKTDLPQVLGKIGDNLPQWAEAISSQVENLDSEKVDKAAEAIGSILNTDNTFVETVQNQNKKEKNEEN